MDSWHSYPSIYALGHRAVADILADPVLVEEKIDGSQFSFGSFDGQLRCRSKGVELNVYAPEGMFKRAVDVAGSLDLRDGWTYRAEYLAKPKHNALAYDRTPKSNLIIFDVNTGHEEYLTSAAKLLEAQRLGLEVVPVLFFGRVDSPQVFRDMLDTTSILGGQKVEGVVVKNYARFGADKKVLMGKFVSEAFKEVHRAEWKAANPKSGDVVVDIIRRFKTPARWQKAVQHMREAGQLEDSPRDIAVLFQEVPADVEKECAEEIKELLYARAWPKVRRGVMAGFAEWYKDRLLERQFEYPDANCITQPDGSCEGQDCMHDPR